MVSPVAPNRNENRIGKDIDGSDPSRVRHRDRKIAHDLGMPSSRPLVEFAENSPNDDGEKHHPAQQGALSPVPFLFPIALVLFRSTYL